MVDIVMKNKGQRNMQVFYSPVEIVVQSRCGNVELSTEILEHKEAVFVAAVLGNGRKTHLLKAYAILAI